ncbi:hypothetical protein B0H13DRAFT_2261798 [Mycena leptocephala]|nr:hypothetical protein B0H13DRAFT_2261798 [Mycena leptocephala]
MKADYLRVSKHGVWVHRKIAVCQENSLHRFHAGWSNFADWINEFTRDSDRKFTNCQSQCLFLEHFSRRLLVFHKKDNFTCESHPSTRLIGEAVRAAIGVNGGVLDAGMTHGCTGCTHLKRYRPDLIAEGAVLGDDQEVAGLENEGRNDQNNIPAGNGDQLPFQLPPQQEAPPEGSPRGYVLLVATDGKTLRHRVRIEFDIDSEMCPK